MEVPRGCLHCSRKLNGRSDKKFCTDKCRSHYNYRLRVSSLGSFRITNSILKKNRSILIRTFQESGPSTTRETMLSNGFDFNHYTGTTVIQGDLTCFLCYEIGYFIPNADQVFIVQIQ